MSKITPLYDAREIAERVESLGGEIREAAGPGEVFLLGILKGASLFLADLLRAVPGEVSYGFIDVIRDHADQGSDAIEIDFLSFTDIRGRDVFVLKDVVATGIIENYLLANLRMHQPRSLRLVALLDRPEARTSELKVDFRAFTVGDGVFAGYGLEQERRFGNLPFIGRMA
jgi:hypoxanthine phosphoribosyltransferase